MLGERLSRITNSLSSTNSAEFFMHKKLGEVVLNSMEPIDTKKVLSERDKNRHLGIYVHVPFCTEICSFCAFHREIPKPGKQGAYVDALETHINDTLSQLDGNQSVGSVYFGGGTPGLLRPPEVRKLFSVISRNVDVSKASVTFELHPENVNDQYIRDLVSVGITRFSVGVQNLSAHERSSLGRNLTSPEEDLEKLRILKNLGVVFNVDLMFGTPQQTMQSWKETLKELVTQVDPGEITLYQYVNAYGSQTRKEIEQGTLGRPGISERHKMYGVAEDALSSFRYDRTSTLSFSKKGRVVNKRKLLNRGRDFIGLGPRTYSKVGKYFFVNDASTNDFVSGSDFARFYGIAVSDWLHKINETVLSFVGDAGGGKNAFDPWKSEAIAQVYGILYYVLNQPRIYRRLKSN